MYLTLQVGQCGNQVADGFFTTLAETIDSKEFEGYSDGIQERFFDAPTPDSLYARSILIDTEPKVISDILSTVESPFCYKDGHCYMGRDGAANNWAMGYYEKGTEVLDQVMKIVRREVERCDDFGGFLIFMSVAGGSGSGLGSYLTEKLKEEYKSFPVVNQVFWPIPLGEVTTQAYNTLLTMNHLQQWSDGIFMFENQNLYNICRLRMGIQDIHMNDMNLVANHQLTSLLCPALMPTGDDSEISDILAHLVGHPQYKILNLRSVPQEPVSCNTFGSYTWNSLHRSLRRMLLYNYAVSERNPSSNTAATNKPYSEYSVSLSNLLLLRGRDSMSASTEILQHPSIPYASLVPPMDRFVCWRHPTGLFKQQRVATIANNGQSIVPSLDEAVEKAWSMFSYKAHIHHYFEHGVENDDVLSAFSSLEQVVKCYKELNAE